MRKNLLHRGSDFEVMEPGAHILQARRARFHNIISPVPAIIWVVKGSKHVSTEREHREVSSDFFVLLPENRAITVENIPHGNEPYEARVLAFGREVFEEAYKGFTIDTDRRRRPFQTVPATAEIGEAFLRARGALLKSENLPGSIVQNRCEEVVLWLAEAGALLPWGRPASIADRARSILVQNPAHSWTAIEVGRELGVSEASLRRKLRAEGTSFKIVLLEIRLLVALTYTQTTNWALPRISSAVGYKSHSRFVTLFEKRFGVHPAEIRTAPD